MKPPFKGSAAMTKSAWERVIDALTFVWYAVSATLVCFLFQSIVWDEEKGHDATKIKASNQPF